jgi:RND family efflux transporter MFP subunit
VRPGVVRRAVVRRAGLALALVAPLLLAACFDDAAASDPEPGVPTVRLVTAGAASAIDSRRFVGRIEPLSVVDLAFQLPGEIVDLPVVQGTVVPEGGTIAALDPAAYELALTRARASLALAEAEYARARDLVERGAAPEARLDQTVADRALAAVGVDSAERDLRLTRIAAPFDALITRRLVDVHSYVTGGTAVVRVQDVTEMRVTISVPEDLVWLARSPESFTAGARLAALPEVVLPLRLREFVTEPDRVAQTYEVSFAIDAPRDPRVLPGMTATVEIRANAAGGASAEVPLGAVDPDGAEGFQVWVYDAATGTVEPRPVALGLPDETSVPVLDGLAEGERIVAAGVAQLVAGQRVRPLEL